MHIFKQAKEEEEETKGGTIPFISMAFIYSIMERRNIECAAAKFDLSIHTIKAASWTSERTYIYTTCYSMSARMYGRVYTVHGCQRG